MMEATSARLALPYLTAGQAQKEVAHNEALTRLDLMVQASVTSVGGNAPPATPGEGRCDVVGTAPVGAWAGHAGAIAGWTAGGWRFVEAREGMAVWSESDGSVARYSGGGWQRGIVTAAAVRIGGKQVLAAQRGAIGDAVGGATIDAEARSALNAVLAALRGHGLIAL